MDVVRADPESELDRILELQRDARHLVAADALEELEARLDGSAAAARCRARLSTSPAVARARELASQLRAARDAFRDGRDDGWIFGVEYMGVSTSYKSGEGGELWLKTEGAMDDMDVLAATAVIREVGLFGEWIPMCKFSRVVRWNSLDHVCAHFALGLSMLTRDAVLEAVACDCTAEDDSLMVVGRSLPAAARAWHGADVPPAPRWPADRMDITGFSAQVLFTSPTALRCKVVCSVDPKMPIPESLMMMLLKKLCGIFLIVWRRAARRVARAARNYGSAEADCAGAEKHIAAIVADEEFYRGFLLRKYLAWVRRHGWRVPPMPLFGVAGDAAAASELGDAGARDDAVACEAVGAEPIPARGERDAGRGARSRWLGSWLAPAPAPRRAHLGDTNKFVYDRARSEWRLAGDAADDADAADDEQACVIRAIEAATLQRELSAAGGARGRRLPHSAHGDPYKGAPPASRAARHRAAAHPGGARRCAMWCAPVAVVLVVAGVTWQLDAVSGIPALLVVAGRE